ncbi:hypothetical protein [Massilia sp. TS11]|uniref:hypothetical protein n=1 Tax=Massilia sp. TS11 TaxID=2908003 RepID=UPI001EDC742D|nr:hypothetical protein [Massilia sp. TS11]MCG2584345.1 hypothetical protein [Massilia sp. TS11]
MNDLLATALDAHGGLAAWTRLGHIHAHAAIGGGLWALKGHSGALDNVRVWVDTRAQATRYAPAGPQGQVVHFRPDLVWISAADGSMLSSRAAPRRHFDGHRFDTPWDALHLAYFAGYALWNYLSLPFSLTLPGVRSEEVAPWVEDGEEWRRLRVLYPAELATHSREQTFYFGPDGLLRRHDYEAELIGAQPVAQYTSALEAVGGILLPTQRRAYARRADNTADRERLAVSLSFSALEASA